MTSKDTALAAKMAAVRLLRNIVMYLPHRLWLSRILKESANFCLEDQEIIVILSCDTEFDPPYLNETWKSRSTRGFIEGMPRLLELCDRYEAPATLFCEARLVEEFPDEFRDLAPSHEIGCHSYNHEWLGTRLPPRFILQRQEFPILSTQAKARILTHARKSIEHAIGKAPRSFKAPFNSVDHVSTLSLLSKLGFDSDSSLPCYNDESFSHPSRPSPCHHVSPADLWSQGTMHLIEVPFTARPQPLFWHPYDTREEVLDMIRRSMRLALECVELQCRIDILSGRHFSVVHVTSHPWEFSNVTGVGGYGKESFKRLQVFFDKLLSTYKIRFLTVSEFTDLWEREWCPLHSSKRMV